MELIEKKVFYRGMALAALIVRNTDDEKDIVKKAAQYAEAMMNHDENERLSQMTPEEIAAEKQKAEDEIPF